MHWYEDEVKRLESAIAGLHHQPCLIFYGSSSIRLWETLEDDFKEFTPLNIGFGGSTMAACSWFFDRVFTKLNPVSIIIYAGDNDLGDGKNPEDVLMVFKLMIQYVQQRYGDIPLGFISIKPSIKRWHIADKIKQTNYLIKELITKTGGNSFYINVYDSMTDANGYPKTELLQPDGLHVSKKGYRLWKEIILNSVAQQNLKLLRA